MNKSCSKDFFSKMVLTWRRGGIEWCKNGKLMSEPKKMTNVTRSEFLTTKVVKIRLKWGVLYPSTYCAIFLFFDHFIHWKKPKNHSVLKMLLILCNTIWWKLQSFQSKWDIFWWFPNMLDNKDQSVFGKTVSRRFICRVGWKGSWNLETPNLSWYKRSHNHHHWFYYPNKIMMYLPWFSVKSWRSVVLTSSLLTQRLCFQLDESTFFARKPNWHFLLHLNPLGRTSCGVTLNVLKLQPWVNTRKC